jgi:ribosomal protein S2
VAITGSDNDLKTVDYAIPSNDASRDTISYIIDEAIKSYKKGVDEAKEKTEN